MTNTRSRFVDYAPTDNALVLQQSDIAIFLLLQEFPYLALPYIGELLGHEKKTYLQSGKPVVRYPSLRRRLGRLRKDGGYLKCPAESWNAANSRYRPAVYALTIKAKAVLKERGLYSQSFKLGTEFAHDFGSCLIPASFRIGVLGQPKLRFIPAQEIIDHPACPASTREAAEPFTIPVSFMHKDKLVETQKEHDWSPWGIGFKLDNGKQRRMFFFGHEFDRDSEPLTSGDIERSSMTRHLLSILSLLDGGYKSHFGIPGGFVPVVTIGQQRMQSIMRLLLKLTDGKGSRHILFKHIDDFSSYASFPPATGHMLTEPWERAGFEPFDILKEIGAA